MAELDEPSRSSDACPWDMGARTFGAIGVFESAYIILKSMSY